VKLVLIKDNGVQIEIKEIEALNSAEGIVCGLKYNIRSDDREELEEYLSKKFQRLVIVLPYVIESVLGIK